MGKLFVVGIGPGGPDGMTIAARRALEAADIVVGYTKYVELALAAVPEEIAAFRGTLGRRGASRDADDARGRTVPPGAFARAERRSRGARVQR